MIQRARSAVAVLLLWVHLGASRPLRYRALFALAPRSRHCDSRAVAIALLNNAASAAEMSSSVVTS